MEQTGIKVESKASKIIKLILKIGVTALCFWYVSRKIDFSAAKEAIFNANVGWVLLAAACFMFGKFLSCFRLNIYFRNINLNLSQWTNIQLYWLGMFYNLFLPGSISGDAYKVILLTRRSDISYKKITLAVLLDRFSGLLALGLIMSAYGIMVLDNKLYDAVLIAGSLLAVTVLYFAVKFFMKDFIPGFWPTFFWGIAVQVMMVLCVYSIMNAISTPLAPEWIFIFLVASVVSVLPISLGGGLGTREVVFIEGARFFELDPNIGVAISLLFYISNLFTSVWGLYFVFNNPLKERLKAI